MGRRPRKRAKSAENRRALRLNDGDRCAIYTRRSRADSRGLSSCESQRQVCDDFARERDWEVLDEHFDDVGESSETLDRPGLQRLLRAVEEGRVDWIVVTSVDRLTRRLFDFQKLLTLFKDQQVKLSVVCDPQFDESAGNRLMTNIVTAATEFQQDLTRERMAESREKLKGQGRRVAGRVPFGYLANRQTKQLVIEPQEAERVRRMFQLAAEGKRPQEIADFANSAGWRTKTRVGERRWTARQVLKLLSNPTYSGEIRNGSETRPGAHSGIVTREQVDHVRQLIEGRRSRKPGREESTTTWPL